MRKLNFTNFFPRIPSLEQINWRNIFFVIFSFLIYLIFILVLIDKAWFFIDPSGFWIEKSFWDMSDREKMTAYFQLEAPIFEPRVKSFGGSDASITLEGLDFVTDENNPISKVCVVNIPFEDYVFSIENKPLRKLGGFDLIETPVCSDVHLSGGLYQTGIGLSGINAEYRPIDLGVSLRDMMYPFTSGWHRIAFQVNYYTIDAKNKQSEIKTISPDIYVAINDRLGWDIEFTPSTENLTKDVLEQASAFRPGVAKTLLINFSGPLYYRAFSIFILFGMLILVVMLFQLRETSTFIEATAAVFFGIYGVKQLLIPPTLSIRTILDVCILLLYSIVVYSIIDHFIFSLILKARWGKNNSVNEEKLQIVSGISSKLYHRKSCRFTSTLLRDKRIYYSSEEDAEKMGKKACRHCFRKSDDDHKSTDKIIENI